MVEEQPVEQNRESCNIIHDLEVQDRHNRTLSVDGSTIHHIKAEPSPHVAAQEVTFSEGTMGSIQRYTSHKRRDASSEDRGYVPVDGRADLEDTAASDEISEAFARQPNSKDISNPTLHSSLEQDSNPDHDLAASQYTPIQHESTSPFSNRQEPVEEEVEVEVEVEGEGEGPVPLNAPVTVVKGQIKIRAYAKLEFEDADYYMNTFSIIIGRDKPAKRSAPKRESEDTAPSSEPRRKRRSRMSTGTKSSSSRKSSTIAKDYMDFDTLMASLAPNAQSRAKDLDAFPSPNVCPLVAINDHVRDGGTHIRFTAISRKHLLIAFNFDRCLFEVKILGGNGTFIDDVWHPKDDVQPLKNGTVLQIGGTSIRFTLPDLAIGETGAEYIVRTNLISQPEADVENDENEEGGIITNNAQNENNEISEESIRSDDEDVDEDEDLAHDQKAQSEEDADGEIVSDEETKIGRGLAKGRKRGKNELKRKAKLKVKRKANTKGKAKVRVEPPPKPLSNPDPSIPVPKRRGPGRPPKNGIISKREQALQARQAREAAKAAAQKEAEENGTVKVENGPNGEIAALQPATTKRKYTKRKSKDAKAGEQNGDCQSTENMESAVSESQRLTPRPLKEKRPPKRPRSPSPVYDESTMTPEQLAKPQSSYVVLIHEALSNSPTGAMSLPQIYRAIERRYPFYKLRVTTNGWQSSVRHNLSQHAAFRKIEREGKGWMWGLVPEVSIEKEKKRRPTPPAPPQQQCYQGQMIQNPCYQGASPSNGQIPHIMSYPTPYGIPPNFFPHPLPGHLPPNGPSGFPLSLDTHMNSSSTYQSPYQSTPPVQPPPETIPLHHQSPQQIQSQPFQQPFQQPLIPQLQSAQQSQQQFQENSLQMSSSHYLSRNALDDTNKMVQMGQLNRDARPLSSNLSVEHGPNVESASNPQSLQLSSSSHPHPPLNNLNLPIKVTQEVLDALSRFKNGFLRQMEDKVRGGILVDSAINRTLGRQAKSSVSETEEDPQEKILMQHLSKMLDDLNKKTLEVQRQISQPPPPKTPPSLSHSHPPPTQMNGPQTKLQDPAVNYDASNQHSSPRNGLPTQRRSTSLIIPSDNASNRQAHVDGASSRPASDIPMSNSLSPDPDTPLRDAPARVNEIASPESKIGMKRGLEEDPESTTNLGQPDAKRLALE